MREIKFRAKVCKPLREVIFIPSYRKEGEWVIGDLHLRTNIPHIHECGNDKFPIDINTIGQFTGLHDKNGKEIYEWDIICSPRGNKHYIIYDDNNGSYAAVKIGNKPEDGMCSITKYWIEHYEKEVVGNIYDNPEMMEAQK